MFDLTLSGESVMNHKKRGSEKIKLQCGITGERAIDGFENIEALLEARGSISFGASISSLSAVPYWLRFGTPAFWTKGLEDPVASTINVR
jgi:hypothetical protein